MAWAHAIWLAIGSLLGAAHAQGIWRSARHPTSLTAVMGLLRLLLVGLTLAAAAIFGGIIPAVIGWAVGLFVTAGLVIVTRTRTMQRRAAP